MDLTLITYFTIIKVYDNHFEIYGPGYRYKKAFYKYRYAVRYMNLSPTLR